MANKISVDKAFADIAEHVIPLTSEEIAVDARALGWVSARPILAAADAPRRDCSAMDGFVLRSADTAGASPDEPFRLAIGPHLAAEAISLALPPHLAFPISTGAPIPAGADTVLIKERAKVENGTLLFFEPAAVGKNIRSRGEDALRGTTILPTGTPLTPDAIGALLAFGVRRLTARRSPRIHILPTGLELAPADTAACEMRFDNNGPMIAAMCRALSLDNEVSAPLPDCVDHIAAHIAGAYSGRSEIVVTTGGVSVGSRDFVREAVESLGACVHFHGVAMRPGKPLLFATLPDGRPFFGLPGNPVAALVSFRFFVWAAICRSMGLPIETGRSVRSPIMGRPGTSLFLRARYDEPFNGSLDVGLDQRSHILSSVLAATGWLRVEQSENGTEAWLFPKMPSLIERRPSGSNRPRHARRGYRFPPD